MFNIKTKLITKFIFILICSYFFKSFCYANHNESLNQVHVKFVFGTVFVGTVCSKYGCSSLMDVGSEHKMNLIAGDTFCVDIVEFPATHLTSIVRLDYYYKVIKTNNDLNMKVWGFSFYPFFNYSSESFEFLNYENTYSKLPCSNWDFTNPLNNKY
ncbi:hypothetical protein [Silvanigrella sp.]|jgi:hypothetical protein|uniref:hypothetical protein n=1 Tax=Silvanigrella sp. TaxID=2024976 RepID=UPI0037CA6FEE|nr:hypothetical protein [Silvanigrellaceae bacterium]